MEGKIGKMLIDTVKDTSGLDKFSSGKFTLLRLFKHEYDRMTKLMEVMLAEGDIQGFKNIVLNFALYVNTIEAMKAENKEHFEDIISEFQERFLKAAIPAIETLEQIAVDRKYKEGN